VKSLNLNIQVW